ncbi:MAG: hypothetical protein ACRC6I_06185 [Paracoccaceae bacterium]
MSSKRWWLLALVLGVAGYGFSRTILPYLLADDLVIRVELNDAAEDCVSRRSKLFGAAYRSEVPSHAVLAYCGIIRTDHGGFLLPETRFLWRLGVEERSVLDQRLTENSCYAVRAFGFGDTPRRGDAVATRGNWEILSVVDEVDCPG